MTDKIIEITIDEKEELSMKQHFLDVYFKQGRYECAFDKEPYCSIKIPDGFNGYDEAREKALKLMKSLDKDGVNLVAVERYSIKDNKHEIF